MVYVTSAENMAVRPGQHVDVQGKIYHPYLVRWAENWDKSNILDLIEILRDIFAREPPLVSRPPCNTSQPPSPPPRPGIVRPVVQDPRQREESLPRTSLKPRTLDQQRSSAESPRWESGPPLPPLPRPPKDENSRHSYQTPSSLNLPTNHTRQRSTSLGYESALPPPLPPHPHKLSRTQALKDPMNHLSSVSTHESQYNPSYFTPQPVTDLPFSRNQVGASSSSQQHAHSNRELHHPPLQTQPPLPPASPQTKPPPPPDLLSTPLLLEAPFSETEFAAPPVPPNPEKDLLLHSIGHALYSYRQNLDAKKSSSLIGLAGQRNAMQTSLASMEAEIQALDSLNETLKKNTEILHNALRDADDVISSSRQRALPNVDELLVAQTVVANQLYELVSEERSLGDALFVLGRAVERGRISAVVFSKVTRSLAREWYLKKALVRKIGQGMGLTMY